MKGNAHKADLKIIQFLFGFELFRFRAGGILLHFR